jgi:hypothetical protein
LCQQVSVIQAGRPAVPRMAGARFLVARGRSCSVDALIASPCCLVLVILIVRQRTRKPGVAKERRVVLREAVFEETRVG